MNKPLHVAAIAVFALGYQGAVMADDALGNQSMQLASYGEERMLQPRQDRLQKIQALESQLVATSLLYAEAWKVASAKVNQAIDSGNDDAVAKASHELTHMIKVYAAESGKLNRELLAAVKNGR